jgi:TetR/AcrR family transcriptional regulator
VNKQLVYHYFGSKDRLYLAVLEDAYRRFTARFTKTDIHSGTAAERLTKYVELLFDSLQIDSEFLSLVTDQNLHGGRHIKQSKTVRNILSPLISDLETIISHAREERTLKLNVEATDLYLTIAGICAFYFTNINTLSAGLGQQFDTKSAIAKRRKSIVEFILSAVLDPSR